LRFWPEIELAAGVETRLLILSPLEERLARGLEGAVENRKELEGLGCEDGLVAFCGA
jgi:hypothetical protein